MLNSEPLDSRPTVGSTEVPVSLGTRGAEEFNDIGVDIPWRIVALTRAEEPLTVSLAIVQFV